MTPRFLTLTALMAALASPLAAQTPDFGQDTSPWANDGECDDPRFQGPGMAQTPLLDSDILADATDCRNAFSMGTVTLAGGVTTPTTTPTKTPQGQTTTPTTIPVAGGINFGDDSSQWANDGECDDRRFVGAGMTRAGLSKENIGRDATDCRNLFNAGQLRLWDMAVSAEATMCSAINFGTDSGQYANDGECDDPRFEGMGVSYVLNPSLEGLDATDCRRMCELGAATLRDY